jgi:colanic acid/amylovoran biosynthesis protein
MSPVTMFTSTLQLMRCALWNIFHKPFPELSKRLLSGQELKAYSDADVIIDISMDLLNDSYIGALPVIEHTKALLMGILLKKPVVIWAQSPGPYKSKIIAKLVKFTLNRAALISIREEISLEIINKLGISKPPVHLTADPAFLLEPAPEKRAREIISEEGYKENDRPLVGLAIGWNNINWKIGAKWYRRWQGAIYRQLLFFLPEGLIRLRHKSNTDKGIAPRITNYFHIDETAKTMDYLVTELNANIVMVPHDYTKAGDERILHSIILERMTNSDKVINLTGNYTASELKAVIGLCDLFIGGKMHANIAATSMSVPTVAIQYKEYSQKFNGIMRLLGQEKYVCDQLVFDDVRQKIQEIWSQRESIRKILKTRTDVIQERGRYNAELLRNLVNSRNAEFQDKKNTVIVTNNIR